MFNQLIILRLKFSRVFITKLNFNQIKYFWKKQIKLYYVNLLVYTVHIYHTMNTLNIVDHYFCVWFFFNWKKHFYLVLTIDSFLNILFLL